MKFYGDYQVYSDSGVDLTLLRENLRRSVEQRWLQNAGMIARAEAFRQAGQRIKRARGETVAPFDAPALLRQLTNHQVEFVVIGGLAMIAHGSGYITKDLDVCYARTETNIKALVASLAPLNPYLRGAPPGLPFDLDALTVQAGLNFTLTTDLGDVDLLGEVSGIGGYDQALAESIELVVFGMSLRVLSLDGLITAKRAAGRLKDQTHLLELEELKKLQQPKEE